jgi:hypothetical protein
MKGEENGGSFVLHTVKIYDRDLSLIHTIEGQDKYNFEQTIELSVNERIASIKIDAIGASTTNIAFLVWHDL